MSFCPVLADLGFTSQRAAEVEKVASLGHTLRGQSGNQLSDLRGATCDLHLIVNPAAEGVVAIPAMLETTSLEFLLKDHEPLLADQSASRLKQGVQCSVGRANVQVPTIETLEVSLLGRLLDRFDQLAERRQRLQELLLELLAIFVSTANDGPNLGIPGSIEERIVVFGPVRYAAPAPLRATACRHADQTISSPSYEGPCASTSNRFWCTPLRDSRCTFRPVFPKIPPLETQVGLAQDCLREMSPEFTRF